VEYLYEQRAGQRAIAGSCNRADNARVDFSNRDPLSRDPSNPRGGSERSSDAERELLSFLDSASIFTTPIAAERGRTFALCKHLPGGF